MEASLQVHDIRTGRQSLTKGASAPVTGDGPFHRVYELLEEATATIAASIPYHTTLRTLTQHMRAPVDAAIAGYPETLSRGNHSTTKLQDRTGGFLPAAELEPSAKPLHGGNPPRPAGPPPPPMHLVPINPEVSWHKHLRSLGYGRV